MSSKHLVTMLLAVPATLLAVSACGSSSSSGGSTPTSSAAAPTSSAAGAPSSAASGSGGSGATFDGDYSGTITANLCTGAAMSIKVSVNGDSSTYNGVLSATSAGFVGPDAADFSVPTGGTEPTVSGSTFTVDGVVLEDIVVSQKKVTLHGSLTCP